MLQAKDAAVMSSDARARLKEQITNCVAEILSKEIAPAIEAAAARSQTTANIELSPNHKIFDYLEGEQALVAAIKLCGYVCSVHRPNRLRNRMEISISWNHIRCMS